MFDKYAAYRQSVQSADREAEFLSDTYRELNRRPALSLREDFCGTFLLCCEWVRQSRRHQAFGVDLDPEPIQYGRDHYLSELSASQQSRIQILQRSVLAPRLPKAEIIAALNFSHFILHERAEMKRYFSRCLAALPRAGLLVADCFGGPGYERANREVRRLDRLTYYWEQAWFDPITRNTEFYIHFKPAGRKLLKRVFTYPWRLWTIRELQELMREVGFRDTFIYWEQSGKDGTGNGRFLRQESGDECESWVAYVVGRK